MLDNHRLRLLRELRDRSTITAVATSLGYTPSAVSQQLRVLEVEAKARLLERDGRRIVLTAAGNVLADHAERILAAVERASADVAAVADDVAGTVRVSAFQSATSTLIPHMLSTIRRDHPRLRVEFHQAEPEAALASLHAQHIDLAIADEYEYTPRADPDRFLREHLLREPVRLVLAAGHPLAEQPGPVSLRSLARQTWVSGAPGSAHDQLIRRACVTLGGFTPDVQHRSDDLTGLVTLVESGHAITLLPELAYRQGRHPISDRALSAHDIAERPLSRSIFTAIRAATATHPALTALRAALREAADRSRSPAPPEPG